MPWSFLSRGLRYIIHLELWICKVCWPCVKFHNRIADAWWVTQELACNVASNSGFPFLIVSHRFGEFLTALERKIGISSKAARQKSRVELWVWDLRLHALYVTDMILITSYWVVAAVYLYHFTDCIPTDIMHIIINWATCIAVICSGHFRILLANKYYMTCLHFLHQW